jgi:hypothetical protein
LLAFVDDDITVVPQFISCLVQEHQDHAHSIVIGTLQPVSRNQPPSEVTFVTAEDLSCSSIEVPFTECLGGFFSVQRSDFLSLGGLQDPAPGFWPNWEDVDFGYRAYQQGFKFRQNLGVIGYHWDYALSDLRTSCLRWERASRSAVRLFHRHPDLLPHLPMFRDKTPIAWQQDSPHLIMRKLARRIASSRPGAISAPSRTRTVFCNHRTAPSLDYRQLYFPWLLGRTARMRSHSKRSAYQMRQFVPGQENPTVVHP